MAHSRSLALMRTMAWHSIFCCTCAVTLVLGGFTGLSGARGEERDTSTVLGRVEKLEEELEQQSPLSRRTDNLSVERTGALPAGVTFSSKDQPNWAETNRANSQAHSSSRQAGGRSTGVVLRARLEPLHESVDMASSTMRRLALNMVDHLFNLANRLRFTCTQGLVGVKAFRALLRCPDFQPCAATLTSKTGERYTHLALGTQLAPDGAISACSSGFSDAEDVHWPKPPLNCRGWYSSVASERRRVKKTEPPLTFLGSAGAAVPDAFRQAPQLGCAHAVDFTPESPVAYSVYKLQNVYVSSEAVVFNRSTVFLRLGCQDGVHRQYPTRFAAGSSTVKRVSAVVNWTYRQGGNFFHTLIESFPLFLSLAPIMNKNRDLPLLGLSLQFHLYGRCLEPLVGVPLDNLKRYEQKNGELYLADTLYQPVMQICGHQSKGLWTELRRRHLLHPEGVPLFNPDWSTRHTNPLSDTEMAHIPDDWVVVVTQRPGSKRSIKQIKRLEEALIEFFPQGRVVVFKGSRNMVQARDLFRRARLLIAGHGAAMANMIFMPSKAAVVEIRPEQYPNSCFHSLADACSLDYNLLFANGTGSGRVSVDVEKVMSLVKDIAALY